MDEQKDINWSTFEYCFWFRRNDQIIVPLVELFNQKGLYIDYSELLYKILHKDMDPSIIKRILYYLPVIDSDMMSHAARSAANWDEIFLRNTNEDVIKLLLEKNYTQEVYKKDPNISIDNQMIEFDYVKMFNCICKKWDAQRLKEYIFRILVTGNYSVLKYIPKELINISHDDIMLCNNYGHFDMVNFLLEKYITDNTNDNI